MKLMLMISAVVGMTMLVSLAQDKIACAGGGCCCLLADGSECCSYDLTCTGCPCAL
jgi:hypothetical protein